MSRTYNVENVAGEVILRDVSASDIEKKLGIPCRSVIHICERGTIYGHRYRIKICREGIIYTGQEKLSVYDTVTEGFVAKNVQREVVMKRFKITRAKLASVIVQHIQVQGRYYIFRMVDNEVDIPLWLRAWEQITLDAKRVLEIKRAAI